MSLFNNKDTHLTYKYKLRKLSVLYEDGTEESIQPTRLTAISIEHDYESNYFPIIKITLALNTNVYYKILDNKNTCKIFLRITKFAYKNNDTNSKTPEKLLINQAFNLIMNEGTDNIYDAVKRGEERGYTKIKKDIQLNTAGDENIVDFYLYSDNVINTRKIINSVYSNVTISDVITKIFNDSKMKKVFMLTPDNINTYKELLIPPLSVVKSLSFIDTYYGIYNSGSIIYFDIDKCFIVPFNGKPFKTNNMSGNDITNIVIPITIGSSMSSSTGVISKHDSDENFIVMDGDTISVENLSISNNYITGNDLLLLDGYEGSTSSTSSASSKNSNFMNISENITMNSLLGSMYTAQTSAISEIVSMKLDDYDVSMIGLDKVIHVVFEDTKLTKKYNSNYILSFVRHSFARQGEEMMLTSYITLKKS